MRFSSLRAIPLMVILFSAGCSGETATLPVVPPAVAVSAPIEEEVAGWDIFTGRVDSVDTVEIRPRVSGYVQHVGFHDGDIVQKGDLLFSVDPRPYQAAVTQTEGQFAQANSQLALATKELARAKSLVAKEATSASVLDQRQQARESAQAAVTIATGALDRAKLDLEFTKIYAPIAGRISRKLVSEGNLVAGGDANATLLTIIVSLDPIDVYFDIDEESYLRYGRLAEEGKRKTTSNLGSQVLVALPGDSKPSFSGKLDFVENRLDVSTGTLRARARVANPGHTLKPGQFARVSIVGDAMHPALLVPDSAVTSEATDHVLYVVDADDHIVSHTVVLGRLFGKLREIVQGLEPSDRVVVSGIQRVQPGARVTVELRPIDPKQFALMGDPA